MALSNYPNKVTPSGSGNTFSKNHIGMKIRIPSPKILTPRISNLSYKHASCVDTNGFSCRIENYYFPGRAALSSTSLPPSFPLPSPQMPPIINESDIFGRPKPFRPHGKLTCHMPSLIRGTRCESTKKRGQVYRYSLRIFVCSRSPQERGASPPQNKHFR